MATKKDVVGLAKKTTTKKKTARKPAPKKPVEKKLTAAQERDLKAKETVEKLLEDSPITTLDKKDELLELEEPTQEPKGVEWLEEQVTLLTQQKEALAADLKLVQVENQQLRDGTGVSTGDDELK